MGGTSLYSILNSQPPEEMGPEQVCAAPKVAQQWGQVWLIRAASSPPASPGSPSFILSLSPRCGLWGGGCLRAGSTLTTRWLQDICYCVSSSSHPDGRPAGRGLPGGPGREECAPTPGPIWPPSWPICFPLPYAAAAGPLEPARRGVKFMWLGLEPAVTGPHTFTQTHTGHPPPTPLHVCAHTHTHSSPPPTSPNTPTISHSLPSTNTRDFQLTHTPVNAIPNPDTHTHTTTHSQNRPLLTNTHRHTRIRTR